MSCLLMAVATVLALIVGVNDIAAQPVAPPRDARPPRTGTARIAGRVVAGDTGRPLRRAVVRASGAALGGPPRSTMTDADGRYEFSDLPAGDYLVSATKGNYVIMGYRQTRVNQPARPITVADGQLVDQVDIILPRGGVITGRVLDEFGDPVTNATVTPMRWSYGPTGRRIGGGGRPAMTNDIGEFRLYGLSPGDYVITARLDEMTMGPISDPSPDRTGYGTTFYPGTADESQAQTVRVTLSSQSPDLIIPLVPSRTATISGIAYDAGGRPMANGSVSVIRRVGGVMSGGPGGAIKPDGTFSFSGVTPGEYVLRANAPGPPPMVTVGPAAPVSARNTTPLAVVRVQGDDIGGVILAVPRLATVTGRVVGEGALLARLRPGAVRVGAQLVDPADPMAMLAAPPAPAKDDLTFEYQTGPGHSYLRATAPGYFVKAIWMNGVDVIDSPVEIREGDELRGVEVEITDRVQRLSGMVTDPAGKAPDNYTVIVFADDPARRGGITRYTAVGRPDRAGAWSVGTLPPGDYYAVALEYVEGGQWTDAEFLESLQPHATRVTVAEGETRTLSLKLLQAQ